MSKVNTKVLRYFFTGQDAKLYFTLITKQLMKGIEDAHVLPEEVQICNPSNAYDL